MMANSLISSSELGAFKRSVSWTFRYSRPITGVRSTCSYLSSAPVGFSGSVDARTERESEALVLTRVEVWVLDMVNGGSCCYCFSERRNAVYKPRCHCSKMASYWEEGQNSVIYGIRGRQYVVLRPERQRIGMGLARNFAPIHAL